MPRKSFGQQVRKYREAESLSQSAAAAKWGVNLKTLQAWEIGQSSPNAFVAKCILFYLHWKKYHEDEDGRGAKR